MTATEKATHTPGAIRAATILWENIFQKARAVDDPTGQRKRAWVSMTAELIARETAAPDLLAALKHAEAGFLMITEGLAGAPEELARKNFHSVRAAIAKAEGGAA